MASSAVKARGLDLEPHRATLPPMRALPPRLALLLPLLPHCAASAPPAPAGPLSAPAPTSAPPRPLPDAPVSPTAPASSRFDTRVLGDPAPSAVDPSLFRPSRPGRNIDLDLKDADLANVCRLLADVGRVNIVLGDDVHGTVTVRLRQVPWDRALDVILSTHGLHAERRQDVILIRAK